MAEASRLTGIPMDLETRASVVIYFMAQSSPSTEPYVILNGSGSGIVNQIAVLTTVEPSYAPSGLHLISVTILGDRSETDEQLTEISKHELSNWFPNSEVENWRCLRLYRIQNAQLAQLPGFESRRPTIPTKIKGVFLAGEYASNSSIEGAVASGEAAAKKIAYYLEEKR